MDILDHALEQSSQDKSGEDLNNQSEGTLQISQDGDEGPILDSTVQYQFRTDPTGQGQVTYRVVQVNEAGEGESVMTTTALPPGTQVAQAVIQSPFSNGSGSPNGDGLGGETRFTYVPAVSAGGDGVQVTSAEAIGSLGQVATQGGQFYVMMSPQDVLQGPRTIAPRTQFSKPENIRSTGRDERRRHTHNEVERRRRDKINNWIVNLSKLIPDCSQDHTKQGQSKGGILAKACDYIQDLRTANARMAESLKETERLSVDLELLRQQCDELKHENELLRSQMQQHGIPPPDFGGSNP